MEYNTSLPHLIIPEYGRNVQKMVQSIIKIEDREKRNHQAKAIIEVMGNLNPHLRDVTDFKHKLWDHLFIMSEFELDVDSPYGKPSKESFEEKPEKVTYSTNNIKFRHYGKILLEIIEHVIDLEPRPQANNLHPNCQFLHFRFSSTQLHNHMIGLRLRRHPVTADRLQI